MESIVYPIGPVDAGRCLWCGDVARFVPSGKRGKWCSRTCESRGGRFRRDKLGPWCTIDGCSRGVLNVGKGLCSTHYSDWRRANVVTYEFTCTQCGKVVGTSRKAQHDSENRFCSKECSVAWNNENAVWEHRSRTVFIPSPHTLQEAACSECGDMFYSLASKPIRKFCGGPCRSRANAEMLRDRRSPLRVAYEDGDGEGFIEEVSRKCEVNESGCWVWPNLKRGYPRAIIGKLHVYVHRAVLEAKEGADLGVQAAHHKCGNPACVNPDHLQPVSAADNSAEMLHRKALTDRIAELESWIREVDPNSDILDRIPIT